MKKFLSFALVLMLVFATAVPAMAASGLYFEYGGKNPTGHGGTTAIYVYDDDDELIGTAYVGNGYFGGQNDTLKNDVTVTIDGKDYTLNTDGSVTLDVPPHVCDYIKTHVGKEVDVEIVKTSGNTNFYAFVITEEYEHVCECDERLENTFEEITLDIDLANNYKGNVTVGDYTVFIDSKGNTQVIELYIVE